MDFNDITHEFVKKYDEITRYGVEMYKAKLRTISGLTLFNDDFRAIEQAGTHFVNYSLGYGVYIKGTYEGHPVSFVLRPGLYMTDLMLDQIYHKSQFYVFSVNFYGAGHHTVTTEIIEAELKKLAARRDKIVKKPQKHATHEQIIPNPI